jgi:hypothetical protein
MVRNWLRPLRRQRHAARSARSLREIKPIVELLENRLLPTSFFAPSNLLAGLNPAAVVVADFNGDSIPDYAVTNNVSGTVSVFLGNGDGTFTKSGDFAAGANPVGIAAGQFGDGHVDLVVANNQAAGSYNFTLLVGDGTGHFTPSSFFVPNAVGTYGVAIADINNDNHQDIILANSGDSSGNSSSVSVLFGNGNGTFQIPANNISATGVLGMRAVSIGDFNGDGHPDLATADFNSSQVSIWLGNGDGTFKSPANFADGTGPSSIAIGDFNGDGKQDLAIANNGSNNVGILQGNGNGTFKTLPSVNVGNAPTSVIQTDINGDGKQDLIVSNAKDNTLSLALGNGNGTFQTPTLLGTGQGPNYVASADFNTDGKTDLVVADNIGSTATIYLGNGNGTFLTAPSYATGLAPGALVVGDFVNDGNSDDVVVLNPTGPGFTLFIGNGDGTFQTGKFIPTLVTSPTGVAEGNFFGSGNEDLAITGLNSSGSGIVNVLPGAGNGTFGSGVNVSVGKNPNGVAVGDVNSDGNSDLVVANNADNTVDVVLGNGNGTFQAAVSYAVGTSPKGVALVRRNPTGPLDIVTANNGSANVSVLLNNGNGSFQAAVNIAVGNNPIAVVAADFNNDTFGDFAVTGLDPVTNTGLVSIVLGNGNGTFQNTLNTVRVGNNPVAAAVGDFNGGGSQGDGIPDLAIANANSFDASVLLGNGDGSFATSLEYLAGVSPTAIGVGDFNNDGSQDLVVSNAGSNSISVILNNPELPVLNVTGPASVTAGSNFSITVTATFPSDLKTDTKYQGTVHFTSSDPLAVLPADYTFKLSDNGVHTFSGVQLKTAGLKSITATDTLKGSITGTTNPEILVNPAATVKLLFTAPATVTAGVPFTVTVTAQDTFGNTTPLYTGTIHFATSDPSFGLLPGDYTFTGSGTGNDNGVHTFTNGVSLHTAGTQTITATDTVTASITGNAIVNVLAAPAASLLLVAPGSASAGTPFAVTVEAFDQFHNIATGYLGTVHFTSSDAKGVLPPDYAFVAADAGVHTFFNAAQGYVALETAGSQTLTVTDTVTSSLTSTATITVNPGAINGFAVTGPASTGAGVPFSATVRAEDVFGNTVTSYGGTVHFSSSDTQATLPSPDYMFVPGDQGVHTFSGVILRTAGTQTVVASDTVFLTLTGAADVVVQSATATSLTIAAPATVTAGASFTATVTARDAFGNAATTYTGTVHFASSDTNSLVSLPADYTFVNADMGSHAFLVTLITAGSQTLTVSDAVNSFSQTVPIQVNPAAANHLTIAAPASTTAGALMSFSVTARDPFNNVATSYTGTIHFSTTDSQAKLPGDFTFAPADAGTAAFTATLGTGGNQTLTATDTVAAGINGNAVVLVTPGAATHLALTAPSQVVAGAGFSLTVTALDAFGNTATGYTGTVHFSSTDLAASLPANYTFVGTDQGIHGFDVTLKTAGAQTFTVADTITATITGTGVVTVVPGSATHFGLLTPASVTAGSAFLTTVTALDAFGNTATGYGGDIHFSSSDVLAVLPVNFLFTATDAGVHTFLVTLHTPVFQTLGVADVATTSITGSITVHVVTAYLAVGADAGGGPEVKVFDAVTGNKVLDFFAYDPRFLGGVRVAVGDVNGDGVPDIITAPGPGGGPDIRVFDGTTGTLIREFMAYDPRFLGGVFVAAGDLNGDGFADIVTAPDFNGGPEVKAFSGKDGSVLQDFMAYDPRFLGGVRVAVGDIKGTGQADIITAPGAPGGPDIRIFDGISGALVQEYLAYDLGYLGGVYVAAGDLNGDGKADVITGTGSAPGQSANVRAFSGVNGALLQNFLAYVPGFTGGVRVGYLPDINGDGQGEILTGAGPSGGPQIETFDGVSNAVLDSFYAFDPSFLGGVYVGG